MMESCPPERIVFLSAEALSGDDWQELDASGGRHPPRAPVLIVKMHQGQWGVWLHYGIQGIFKVKGQLRSLVWCLTWSRALVWLWWFCLRWWWHRLCSSGPEGEGRPRTQLSAPRSPAAWLKCFVALPSGPRSLALKTRLSSGTRCTCQTHSWMLQILLCCWCALSYAFVALFFLSCFGSFSSPLSRVKVRGCRNLFSPRGKLWFVKKQTLAL